MSAKDLAPVDIPLGRARRIIEDGIEAAETGNQAVEDWVARHIAWQLRDEDGSGFDVLARTGEVTDELTPEMMRAYIQVPPRRRWLEALEAYADQREDRGPVDGWAERGRIRDDFDAAWRDRDRERGNRFREGRELDREIRRAQEARQVVGDELAMRLLARLASSPHGVVARFAADGRVADELSREIAGTIPIRHRAGTSVAERAGVVDRCQRRAESNALVAFAGTGGADHRGAG